jgi:drug/metabolite transporter (DMT)-like permease
VPDRPFRPGAAEIALLLSLATLWSSSFAFIKIAVETIPPLSVAAGWLLLAAVLIVAVAQLRGLRFPREDGLWPKFLAVGLFGNALPFTLISWGEVTIDSGLAAILMAVMPLATLVLAHFFTSDERMNPARVVGVFLGFGGVLVLIGPAALAGLGDEAIRQTAVAGGAVCYAVATVIARRLPRMPLLLSGAGALMASVLWSLPLALLIDRPWELAPSAESVGSVVVLGLFPTALAILMYFALLQRTGATFIALNNYLIPSLGVIWGVLFLGEELSFRAMLALGIILAGIAVTRIGMRQGAAKG